MDQNTVLIALTIDENLRTIAIPTNGVVFGVVGDVEVNRVQFVLPRYFRGFDLTEFTARVNYANPNGDANYYEADDITDTDGNCTFTWLMGSDVTAYVGDVTFSITLYKKEGDTVTHRFGTRPATGRVLEGYSVETSVTPAQQKTLVEKISEEVKTSLDDYTEEKKNDIDNMANSTIDKYSKSLIEDVRNTVILSDNKNLSCITGILYTSDIYSKIQVNVMNNVEKIFFSKPEILSSKDIRLACVLHNESYDHRIIIKSDDTTVILPYNPDSLCNEGFAFGSHVSIKYNWDSLNYMNEAVSNLRIVDTISRVLENNVDDTENIKTILGIGYIGDELINETTYVGYYLSPKGVKASTSNSAFSVHQFPVQAGKTYVLNGSYRLPSTDYPVASYSQNSEVTKNITIIIDKPSDHNKTDVNVVFTPDYDGYINTYSYNNENVNYGKVSAYTGKMISRVLENNVDDTIYNIQVFGDSISDELWRSDKTTWVTLLPNYMNGINCNISNEAVGGSGIGHGYANNGSGSRYSEKTDGNYVYDLLTDGTLDTTSDIIIIFVGTNNWAGGSELGSFGDSTISTFYGAIKLILEKITTETSALCLVCAMPGRYNKTDQTRDTNEYGTPINVNGKTLRDYCDALCEVANLYGVPIIDLNYELGWNRFNIGNFSSDGLHPNKNACDKISRIIASNIKNHLGL